MRLFFYDMVHCIVHGYTSHHKALCIVDAGSSRNMVPMEEDKLVVKTTHKLSMRAREHMVSPSFRSCDSTVQVEDGGKRKGLPGHKNRCRF